jgi:cephalosporin hydroxylase
MGYEMYKCPLDLWIYQELIFFNRPQVVVETGTYMGGSALFLATMLDLIGQGEVITIDSDLTYDSYRPRHPRITYLTGSSVDPAILGEVDRRLTDRPNAMVILDADHRKEHVLAELRAYAQYVPPNGYMIVEDTNINGHPTYRDFGPGPWEAVTDFLAERSDFVADRTCERFLVTMNPRGFLKRRG